MEKPQTGKGPSDLYLTWVPRRYYRFLKSEFIAVAMLLRAVYRLSSKHCIMKIPPTAILLAIFMTFTAFSDATAARPLIGQYTGQAVLVNGGRERLTYTDISLRVGPTGRVVGTAERSGALGNQTVRVRGRFRGRVRETANGPELLSRFVMRFSDQAVARGRVDTLLSGRGDKVSSFTGQMVNGDFEGALTADRR